MDFHRNVWSPERTHLKLEQHTFFVWRFRHSVVTSVGFIVRIATQSPFHFTPKCGNLKHTKTYYMGHITTHFWLILLIICDYNVQRCSELLQPIIAGRFQTFFIFHNIWDNPSHRLIFFRGLKPPPSMSYQLTVSFGRSTWCVFATSTSEPGHWTEIRSRESESSSRRIMVGWPETCQTWSVDWPSPI
jgi:hypothetical protein